MRWLKSLVLALLLCLPGTAAFAGIGGEIGATFPVGGGGSSSSAGALENYAALAGEALTVEAALRRDLAAGRDALDGLRHAASTLRDELSAYSQPAAADAAATAAELLAECGRSYSDVAEKADRHAGDALMLHEGWPR